MEPAEALELLWEYLELDGEKESLPYAPWQKENYEKLMGVSLPDYYYVSVIPKSQKMRKQENTGDICIIMIWRSKRENISMSYIAGRMANGNDIGFMIRQER